MCTDLQFLGISHRISQSNLHIRCDRFETPQACTVLNLVRHYHERCNRIFIDLREAGQPHPAAAQCLRAAFRQARVSPQRIVYKGAGGFALAQKVMLRRLRPMRLPEWPRREKKCVVSNLG